MAGQVSAFYPPRARWYSPGLSLASRLRHRLALDWLHFPKGTSVIGAFAAVLVPGAAFYVRGPRLWGNIALGAAGVLVLVMVAWFGFQAATIAFGLLLALHGCGLAYLVEPSLVAPDFRARSLLTTTLLALLSLGLYLPARKLVLDHAFFPLRMDGRVIIVHRGVATASLHRGDIIAYSFDGLDAVGLIVQAGYGLGPLLGMPGDKLRFTPSALEVNGLPQAHLTLMPQAGQWQVPEKHWFVWPEFAIRGHGHVETSGISESVMLLSTISEKQILGRPCRRWLWRRQL